MKQNESVCMNRCAAVINAQIEPLVEIYQQLRLLSILKQQPTTDYVGGLSPLWVIAL